MTKELGTVLIAGALAAALRTAAAYAEEAPPATDPQTATDASPAAEPTQETGSTGAAEPTETAPSDAK